MELSNFELTKTNGKNAIDLEYFAEVDVTTETEILWWKKKETIRREIRREYAGSCTLRATENLRPAHRLKNWPGRGKPVQGKTYNELR